MLGLRRTGEVLTQTIRKTYSIVFTVFYINVIIMCVFLHVLLLFEGRLTPNMSAIYDLNCLQEENLKYID